jgi:hypothetical protein
VEWIQLPQAPVAGCCECGDEPSGSGATVLRQSIGSGKAMGRQSAAVDRDG